MTATARSVVLRSLAQEIADALPADGRGGGADGECLARRRRRRLRHRDADRDPGRARARGLLLARRRLWAHRPWNVGPAGRADEACLGLPRRRSGRAHLVVARARRGRDRRHLRGRSLRDCRRARQRGRLTHVGAAGAVAGAAPPLPGRARAGADRGCSAYVGRVRACRSPDARPPGRTAGARRADGRRRIAGRPHRVRAEPCLAADAQAARGSGCARCHSSPNAWPSGSRRR